MEVSETPRLRSLEDENQRLNQLVAELSLDKIQSEYHFEKWLFVPYNWVDII